MNKKLQYLILFLLLFSCSQKNNKVQSHALNTSNDLVQDSLVIGKWRLNNIITETLSTKCNACPNLILDKNNLAELQYPNNEEDKFQWKLLGNKILFHFDDVNLNQNFFNGEFEYGYKLIEKNNCQCLELSSLKYDKKYIFCK